MKKSKVFAFAGVTLLAATFLAACSGSKDSKSDIKKKIQRMAMFIQMIQQLWITLYLQKLPYTILQQTV